MQGAPISSRIAASKNRTPLGESLVGFFFYLNKIYPQPTDKKGKHQLPIFDLLVFNQRLNVTSSWLSR
jgi:hypothetical protein